MEFDPERMHFSSLLAGYPPKLNPLYKTRDALIHKGECFVDLISGNVTQQNINFPQDQIVEIFRRALAQARVYKPDSLGQQCARQAIAEYYDRAGIDIPPAQILVTPGTSISYFYCFKMLAEAGDEILCPSPSYPLFDIISRMAGVHLTYYRLKEARDWEIDLDYLESRLTTRTRALVLISPHNPTGMVARKSEVECLAEIATRHRLPIISDEVFSEFLFGTAILPRPAQTSAPLVLTLNGFSKMFALPGMKLGWIAVNGEPELVQNAMWTFEMISDTFLPVNEAVQLATPEIFRVGRQFLPAYRDKVRKCRDMAVRILSNQIGFRLIPPEGGFYLTVTLPGEERSEDQIVIDLLQNARTLVHPGYFYDIVPTHLVMTFIQDLDVLDSSLSRLCQQCR